MLPTYPEPATEPPLRNVLRVAADIADRYELSPVQALMESSRSMLERRELFTAVVGRFKAGKSSFLNHLLNRPLLPAGVIPVTAVITEIRFGLKERAEVQFLDGRVEELPMSEIAAYASERKNPGNQKQAATIRAELPELARFRDLVFVDTPGLESVLAHNTDISRNWLPHVGLALVAISIDQPLSQQDLELLNTLRQYTPNVSIVLTKVDLLSLEQREEVLEYVTAQLQKSLGHCPTIFPYSVVPGYDALREQLQQKLIQHTVDEFRERREAILGRKISTLLGECSAYVTLHLKAAELADSEQDALKRKAVRERSSLADVKSELHLVVHNAMLGTRPAFEALLQAHLKSTALRLRAELESQFPSWTKSLAGMLASFEDWLGGSLSAEMSQISRAERSRFEEPLHRVASQVVRHLQNFRDRLSDDVARAFNVPLPTSEVAIEVHEPREPDISTGRIFDRNWELLSPVLPVILIRRLVLHHFSGKVSEAVEANLSRLATQWQQSVNAAMLDVVTEAECRLDGLLATVEQLIQTASSDCIPAIQWDLDQLEAARDALDHPS